MGPWEVQPRALRAKAAGALPPAPRLVSSWVAGKVSGPESCAGDGPPQAHRRQMARCHVGSGGTSGVPPGLPRLPRASGLQRWREDSGPGPSWAPGTTGRCSPFPLPPRSDAAQRGAPGPGPPAGPAAQRLGGRHPHGPHLNPDTQ